MADRNQTTLVPTTVPDKGSTTGYRQEWVPPQPMTTIPQAHFRIKGGRLQQAHGDTGGWRTYWRDVQHVGEDAPDVE